MTAAAARAGSRLVRVIVREIQLLAAGRGQPITLGAEDPDAIAKQVEAWPCSRNRSGLMATKG